MADNVWQNLSQQVSVEDEVASFVELVGELCGDLVHRWASYMVVLPFSHSPLSDRGTPGLQSGLEREKVLTCAVRSSPSCSLC